MAASENSFFCSLGRKVVHPKFLLAELGASKKNNYR